RQQVAEVAVLARTGGGYHEHVALPALLDRDVNHPVVAGCHLAGHRASGSVDRAEDRPQAVGHQSLPPLRFVHGRHTETLETRHERRVDALDPSHHYGHGACLLDDQWLFAILVRNPRGDQWNELEYP